MLKLGAILNFILAVGHLLCLMCLQQVFCIFGITEIMNKCTTYGEAIPYIITVIIAFCFFLCGLYALSADGVIRRLPLLKIGIFFIAAVFLLRSFMGAIDIAHHFSILQFSSTIVAAIIGLLYLLGGIRKFHLANRPL